MRVKIKRKNKIFSLYLTKTVEKVFLNLVSLIGGNIILCVYSWLGRYFLPIPKWFDSAVKMLGSN